MALTIYGLAAYPHDFLVTEAGVPMEQCAFLLDFSRDIEKLRGLLGFGVVGLFVPVVHISEEVGGLMVSVGRDEPYFTDLPKMWKVHRGARTGRTISPADGLEVIADFARHFPKDCK